MSRRVWVAPGVTWAMSRRITRRHYVLNPDEQRKVEKIVLYLLGYYCKKFGLRLHAVCVMSTHIHYVVTDVRGNRPRFKAEFHRVLANCIKAYRGWPEELWNKSATSEQECLTAEAAIGRIAYVIVNPVAAFAVRSHQDWPGLQTLPADVGTRVEVVERPSEYLRNAHLFPDSIEVHFELPAVLEAEYHPEEARRRIATRVGELEAEARQEARQKGIPFLGARRVLQQPHTKRAHSREEFGTMHPRWASGGDREAARRRNDERIEWEARYDRALALWQAGKRSRAVFPYGTWWMVVHHKARVAPPPS